MGYRMATVVLATCGLVGACASGPAAPAGPPTVIAAPGQPAPPQARFYADCVAQAAGAMTYDKEPDANLVRFTCTGDVARAFYDGLADWSAEIGSRVEAEGRSWRFSQKIERNPWGLDYCSTDNAGDHRCVVVLNVGEFLSR